MASENVHIASLLSSTLKRTAVSYWDNVDAHHVSNLVDRTYIDESLHEPHDPSSVHLSTSIVIMSMVTTHHRGLSQILVCGCIILHGSPQSA